MSIDLKDGYWHLPVLPYSRRYMGFSLSGKMCWLSAMSFGLYVAPRLFTKVRKTILRELRFKGIWVLGFPRRLAGLGGLGGSLSGSY